MRRIKSYNYFPSSNNVFFIIQGAYKLSENFFSHNLSKNCRKTVKFVYITHSELNIWDGPIVANAISWEKRKILFEENGCVTDRT
jgi:hypothetical protein